MFSLIYTPDIASKKIDCFEFDPETTSKDDIINNLYDRLKTASQDKKEQFSKE